MSPLQVMAAPHTLQISLGCCFFLYTPSCPLLLQNTMESHVSHLWRSVQNITISMYMISNLNS